MRANGITVEHLGNGYTAADVDALVTALRGRGWDVVAGDTGAWRFSALLEQGRFDADFAEILMGNGGVAPLSVA